MTLTGLEVFYLLAFVAAAVGGVYWRWGAEIGKVRDDLAAHKLHVAENYVSKSGMREVKDEIMDAINGINQRLDRLYSPKPRD